MTKTSKPPRGVRLNNPGNIRKSDTPWQGLAEEQPDPEFCSFASAPQGIRALARTLITYQDKHGLNTVEGMIGRWAPPADRNDTGSYVAAVSSEMEVGPRETINVHDYAVMRPMVIAIIRHENGQQPYTEAQIDKGLLLAGVEPQKPRITQSKTIKGAQVAVLGGSAAAGIPVLVQPLVDHAGTITTVVSTLAQNAPWVLAAFLFVGIAYMAWRRIDDHNKGLR